MAEYKSITGGKIMNYYNDSTLEKCFCVKCTADATIVKGNVLAYIQGGTDGRVGLAPTTGNAHDMGCGIALEGATAGNEFWMAVSGKVQVLPNAGETAVMGYVIKTSDTEAGKTDQSATAPAAADHFTEVGHWVKSGTGNGALTLAIIHFN